MIIIFFLTFLTIVNSQDPLCFKTQYTAGVVFEYDSGRSYVCDYITKSLVAVPPSSMERQSTGCLRRLDGVPFRVVRRVSPAVGAFAEWEFCTQAYDPRGYFNQQVCQVQNECRLKQHIIDKLPTISSYVNETCIELENKLYDYDEAAYNDLFLENSSPCDFSALMTTAALEKILLLKRAPTVPAINNAPRQPVGPAYAEPSHHARPTFFGAQPQPGAPVYYNRPMQQAGPALYDTLPQLGGNVYGRPAEQPGPPFYAWAPQPEVNAYGRPMPQAGPSSFDEPAQPGINVYGRPVPQAGPPFYGAGEPAYYGRPTPQAGPTDQIAPVQEEQIAEVDRCLDGVYNKVFYVNDKPTHCMINEDGPHTDKCIKIDQLYTILQNFSTRGYKLWDSNDYSIQYKSYILHSRTKIYQSGDDYDARRHHYWDDKGTAFKKLFQEAGDLLSRTHPELHFVEYNDTKYGANIFCEMALTHFPVKNIDLFSIAELEDCIPMDTRDSVGETCQISADNRMPINFPAHLNLVYYNANKQPVGCYFPKEHHELRDVKQDQCMSFENALELLNNKDISEPGGSTNERKDYMSGLLRLYHESDRPTTFFPPDTFRWGSLRTYQGPRKPIPVINILKDIESALGYVDDGKYPFNVQHAQDKAVPSKPLELSPHAFCAAIVEMIPFRKSDFDSKMGGC